MGFAIIDIVGESNSFCVSPLSIGLALSLLAGGADAAGLAQFCSLLDTTETKFAPKFQKLMSLLTGAYGDKLSGANAVWCDSGFIMSAEFINYVRSLHAEVDTSFTSLPDAADSINGFVSAHTKGRIPSIVDRGSLMGMNLAFVNALAFDDEWAEEFHKGDTQQRYSFKADGGLTPSGAFVEMMFKYQTKIYTQDGEGYTAICLPFKDATSTHGLYFIAWHPNEGNTVKTVLLSICRDGIPSNFQKEQLKRFGLPKVNFESSREISEILGNLGFPLERFPNMGTSKMPSVTTGLILHKTRIKWDEKSASGAAATVILAFGSAMPPPAPREFVLDKPFPFAIVTACGAPVFTGVYSGVP